MTARMESNTQRNAADSRDGLEGLADTGMTPNSQDDNSASFEHRYSVGAELRMAREDRGLHIRDVVDAVRIQARYLEALEDGRVEDLPGTVYALGFVRTYAEYLGLDGPEMVARFKEEAKGLQSQEYILPEPIDEGKVPTTAIIVIAILLAAAAYGAWHYLYRAETPVVEQVPDIPERLAPLVQPESAMPPTSMPPATAMQDTEATTDVPATPIDGEPPVTVTEPPAPGVVTPLAPPAGEVPPSPVPQPTTETQLPPPADPDPTPAAELAAEGPAVAGEPAPESQPQTAATATQVEEPAVATAEPAPPPPPPASGVDAGDVAAAQSAAVAATEPLSREPRVFGADNPDARIVITAEEDAWIEVTDADGALLFSRVLRVGDTYRVPNRPGAVFVTGNAGGLAVHVDGEPAPPVGPSGVVRRNVRLDPEQLKAGTAWP